MKIRQGFVSNSSSSSFTIYGWTSDELAEYVAGLLPFVTSFEEVRIDFSVDAYDFVKKLQENWDGDIFDLTFSNTEDGEMVFGLGTAGQEVDHYNESFTDAFEYAEPDIASQEKFDELAKKLNLPVPHMHQGTFYE